MARVGGRLRCCPVIASLLRTQLRKSDGYGRWGGEEYILLFPHTDLTTGQKVAEKLRLLMNTITYGDDNLKITVSVGISQLHENESAKSLIRRADEALYEAKRSGRNKV